MRVVHTRCPRVTSPCPQLPTFARGQKSTFCDLCQTRVHNLSAMSAGERERLLGGTGPICVRYSSESFQFEMPNEPVTCD